MSTGYKQAKHTIKMVTKLKLVIHVCIVRIPFLRNVTMYTKNDLQTQESIPIAVNGNKFFFLAHRVVFTIYSYKMNTLVILELVVMNIACCYFLNPWMI